MAFGVELRAPHGGIFVFFAMNNWVLFLVALVAGTVLSAVLVIAAKQVHRSRDAVAFDETRGGRRLTPRRRDHPTTDIRVEPRHRIARRPTTPDLPQSTRRVPMPNTAAVGSRRRTARPTRHDHRRGGRRDRQPRDAGSRGRRSGRRGIGADDRPRGPRRPGWWSRPTTRPRSTPSSISSRRISRISPYAANSDPEVRDLARERGQDLDLHRRAGLGVLRGDDLTLAVDPRDDVAPVERHLGHLHVLATDELANTPEQFGPSLAGPGGDETASAPSAPRNSVRRLPSMASILLIPATLAARKRPPRRRCR